MNSEDSKSVEVVIARKRNDRNDRRDRRGPQNTLEVSPNSNSQSVSSNSQSVSSNFEPPVKKSPKKKMKKVFEQKFEQACQRKSNDNPRTISLTYDKDNERFIMPTCPNFSLTKIIVDSTGKQVPMKVETFTDLCSNKAIDGFINEIDEKASFEFFKRQCEKMCIVCINIFPMPFEKAIFEISFDNGVLRSNNRGVSVIPILKEIDRDFAIIANDFIHYCQRNRYNDVSLAVINTDKHGESKLNVTYKMFDGVPAIICSVKFNIKHDYSSKIFSSESGRIFLYPEQYGEEKDIIIRQESSVKEQKIKKNVMKIEIFIATLITLIIFFFINFFLR